MIFCKPIRDVADAVPYKRIIHHRKIILIFCKPIRDVADAVPYKRITDHRQRNPRPAGEGQGEGNSVDMFIYHQQKYFDSGSPRPVGEGQGEGKWRRYENKSSVKLS